MYSLEVFPAPTRFTEEEANIVNIKATFASTHLFEDPAQSLSYIDMWRRQAVARLVGVSPTHDFGDTIPGLFMTVENRAKVAALLDIHNVK